MLTPNISQQKSLLAFKDFADSASVMMWVTDPSGYSIYLSARWYEFTGQSSGQGEGFGWLDAIHPDDKEHAELVFIHANHHHIKFKVEYRLKNADGAYYWVMDRAAPRFDQDNQFLGYVGTVFDIHELKLAQAALLESNGRFRAAIDAVEGIMWTNDAEGRMVGEQPGWSKLTGQTREEYEGYGWANVVHPDDAELTLDAWRHAVNTKSTFVFEHRLRSSSGEWCLYAIRAIPVFNQDGSIREWVGVHTDITERRHNEARIRYLATHDVLTNLPNRTLLQERLNHILQLRESRQHAILFMDLNRFKLINDSLGHDVGDQLLQQIGKRICRCVRTGDTVARLGGDEFVVLLENVESITNIIHAVDKILHSIALPMKLAGHELSVSASIGCSVYPKDSKDPDTLLKYADLAMYQAKKQGGNVYRFFDHDMNNKMLDRLLKESQLKRALERDEFLVFYQPKINVTQNKIVGLEALIRWDHPQEGFIPPSHFIPIAEEIGIIETIGEWVISTVCTQMSLWRREGFPPTKVSINLSSQQLVSSKFAEHLRHVLIEKEISPGCIEFEITESSLMQNIDMSVMALNDLQSSGVSFSVDDFGTGYSSLYYLKKLPISTLKIDQSFIADLAYDSDDAAIVKATISLAKSMGLDVIAEGVSTQEQIDLLKEYDCDVMQGFFFSPAVTAEQIKVYLTNIEHR